VAQQINSKLVCINCTSPKPLKELVAAQGAQGQCSFCQGESLCISAPVLYGYLWDRIRENTAFIDDLSDYEQVMLYDCGSDDVQVATIDVVLVEWLGLDEDAYVDDALGNLPQDLQLDAYGNERHFFLDEGNLEHNPYDERWSEFVREVSHVHRFFNSRALEFLDELFSDMLAVEGGLDGSSLLILNPGTALFRARKVEGFAKAEQLAKNPASEFGRTPLLLAGSQRMTPNGISALYCALDRDTCLSEIRSITGDTVVSVALTPTEPMTFLDISRLGEGPLASSDLLEKGHLDRVRRASFIRSLVNKMSRPKRSGDELTYLSTQVVFEYLRIKIGTAAHGIAFPSVQTGKKGINVAVFPEYCSIAAPDAAQSGGEYSKQPDDFAVVKGSVVFHKITAVTTSADTYLQASDLFMDDLTRSRFGDPSTEAWRDADKKMQYVDKLKVKRLHSALANRFIRQRG
jgi:hypothetical protein